MKFFRISFPASQREPGGAGRGHAAGISERSLRRFAPRHDTGIIPPRGWIAFAVVSLACLVLPATAQEKAKDAEMIYPRAAAGVDAPAAGKKEDSSNTMLIGLALVAAGVGGWLLWRQKNSPAGLGAQGRKLAIAESRSLGNRQYLVVADYDGRKFLLGVCPGRIEMLTPLGEDDDGEAN